MARLRKKAKPGRRELTLQQEIELVIGPSVTGRSYFTNEQERRAAWRDNREHLLARDTPGSRPWYFWACEGPKDIADDDRRLRFDAMAIDARMSLDDDVERRQFFWLLRQNLLSDEEIGKLLDWGEQEHAHAFTRWQAEQIRARQSRNGYKTAAIPAES